MTCLTLDGLQKPEGWTLKKLGCFSCDLCVGQFTWDREAMMFELVALNTPLHEPVP